STKGIKENLRGEAEVLAKLRSKYIIQFYDFIVKDETPYIVTEYAANGSLADVIENKKIKNNKWYEVVRISIDIANGINFLHENGIIHCDLKSKNILMTRNMDAKIADFGIISIREINEKGQSVYSSNSK